MNTIGRIVSVGCLSAVLGCTSVAQSSPKRVIVDSIMLNETEAQRLADLECAKYQRYANMTIKADSWERSYYFDCLK